LVLQIPYWYYKYRVAGNNAVGIFTVRFPRKAKNISTIITKYISYFSPSPGAIDFQEDK